MKFERDMLPVKLDWCPPLTRLCALLLYQPLKQILSSSVSELIIKSCHLDPSLPSPSLKKLLLFNIWSKAVSFLLVSQYIWKLMLSLLSLGNVAGIRLKSSFGSELLVASQLRSHLLTHSLYDPFQSVFHTSHNTDTGLLRIINDLPLAADYVSRS